VTWFGANAKQWNIRAVPEVRVQTRATSYRVPDVAVLSPSNPMEQIITIPPIAVFEVLSPSDTITKTLRKLADYSSMGIPQILIVDPATGSFFRYADGSVVVQTHFNGEGIEFPFSAIAEMLQD
jgi:Uma2 family endonuclease